MSITLFAISIITAFILGGVTQSLRMRDYAKRNGCPFKYACLQFDPSETRTAVKRVLTLLVDNDVPKKEIRKLVNESLKP